MRTALIVTAACLFALSACQTPAATLAPPPAAISDAPWRPVAPENLVILKTRTGEAIIELAEEAAPEHVRQFREAIRANLYNGEYFYRVIDGHVAQAGLEFEHRLEDWPLLPLEAERQVKAEGFDTFGNADLFADPVGHREGFAVGREGDQEWLLNCPGALGMARDDDPGTGSTEFFIPLAPRRYLDRNYTIFGRVIAGMEHINRLKRVDPVGKEDVPAFVDPATALQKMAERAQRLGDNEIISIGLAADMPEALRPRWEVMATPGPEWEALKAEKRNYGIYDAFVVKPPKVVDICTLPVPARPITQETDPA
ncbi:MAG: peptidylprolyl isomerase [Alphaproteobacteria bacterium]|nr:peptidylprolyl isomerase [Alphaproteobacteria bacterium]|tara:strand:- start:6283 stop:7218 length:936 start_codon:yes stop_codon:yes gene_type:complete